MVSKERAGGQRAPREEDRGRDEVLAVTPASTAGHPNLASTPLWSDDNECLRDPCAGRGRCVNSVGSYSCFCYPGYTLATEGAPQQCQGKLCPPWPRGRDRTKRLGWAPHLPGVQEVQGICSPLPMLQCGECGSWGKRGQTLPAPGRKLTLHPDVR